MSKVILDAELAEPEPIPDPPDPMKACTHKVVMDDPCHPGEKCVLYYTDKTIPLKFKGQEKALKKVGVKEPDTSVSVLDT